MAGPGQSAASAARRTPPGAKPRTRRPISPFPGLLAQHGVCAPANSEWRRDWWVEESAEVSTGVHNEEAALRGGAEPARRGPHDSASAQHALQEWAARAQECRMKRVVARSSRLIRRNLPAERMLRRSVDAWALATVGRSLAQAHTMRQLLSRVLPERRRRTELKVLRCAPLARELVRCTSKPNLPVPRRLAHARASASLAGCCKKMPRCDERAGCSSR